MPYVGTKGNGARVPQLTTTPSAPGGGMIRAGILLTQLPKLSMFTFEVSVQSAGKVPPPLMLDTPVLLL